MPCGKCFIHTLHDKIVYNILHFEPSNRCTRQFVIPKTNILKRFSVVKFYEIMMTFEQKKLKSEIVVECFIQIKMTQAQKYYKRYLFKLASLTSAFLAVSNH